METKTIEVVDTANMVDAHGRDVEKQNVRVIEERKFFICDGNKYDFPAHYEDERCLAVVEKHKTASSKVAQADQVDKVE